MGYQMPRVAGSSMFGSTWPGSSVETSISSVTLGGRVAETAGFIRERVPPSRRDAPSMVGLIDAWWPTLFSIDETFRPMATISFMAELLVEPTDLDASERLFHRARMVSLTDGFFVEFRELWSGDVCVAMNQQTFAVLR